MHAKQNIQIENASVPVMARDSHTIIGNTVPGHTHKRTFESTRLKVTTPHSEDLSSSEFSRPQFSLPEVLTDIEGQGNIASIEFAHGPSASRHNTYTSRSRRLKVTTPYSSGTVLTSAPCNTVADDSCSSLNSFDLSAKQIGNCDHKNKIFKSKISDILNGEITSIESFVRDTELKFTGPLALVGSNYLLELLLMNDPVSYIIRKPSSFPLVSKVVSSPCGDYMMFGIKHYTSRGIVTGKQIGRAHV